MFTVEDLSRARSDYERDGYALLPQLMSGDEIAPLADALDIERPLPGGFSVADSHGNPQELSFFTDLGDDLIGIIPRLEPVVAVVEAMIGEPVYHWHSKISWKRPNTESRWDWHQDYGFWAEEGVDRPDMCTLAIAVGPVHVGNGCMRLVRGSHHRGRIDIVSVGPTRASDPAIVDELLAELSVEPCELDTGDAVVFHGNTLHSSGPNASDEVRTMLMSSYNAVSNPPSNPFGVGHEVGPLDVLPSAAVLDGWTEVFGDTPLLDPSAIDYGYDYY